VKTVIKHEREDSTLGHTEESYVERAFVGHLAAGIDWAGGRGGP
jgi:hypothetical protein